MSILRKDQIPPEVIQELKSNYANVVFKLHSDITSRISSVGLRYRKINSKLKTIKTLDPNTFKLVEFIGHDVTMYTAIIEKQLGDNAKINIIVRRVIAREVATSAKDTTVRG